ncbi:MAG: TolC family protein [Acidobacteriales bacterium]|nr:TolC family protein [Terriglobales bacterium]
MMMIRKFAIAAMILLPSLCAGQIPLGLDQAIAIALSQRPELKAAAARIESAEQLRRQSGLFPNPRFIFQSENIRASDFNYGQDADTFAYASQVIETSGRRKNRIAVAQGAANRSELEAQLGRRDIAEMVRDVYWSALAAEVTRSLYDENLQFFDQILQYHEARLKEGKVAEVDVLRVRLESGRLRAAADNARLDAERAQLELARELGTPSGGPWKLTEDIGQLETPRTAQKSSIGEPRPEGRLAELAVAQAHSVLGLERANGRPDLDALFGYKRTGGLNTAIAGLQFNIPIFNRNQGARAAAAANVRAAEQDLAATHAVLETDLSLARKQYGARREQVESIFRPLRDQAVEISDISRAAYREGGLDLLRLLDAERLRVDAQISLVRALNEFHRSVTALERAEGVQP